MGIFIVLFLALPVVHCPITSITATNGKADLNSLSEHITLLEQQVTTLQFEFESELKSTLIELMNVKNELKASQEERIGLKNGLTEKCRMLKLTSQELNFTKSEIKRLKDDVKGVKASCSATSRSVLNVTEIIGAINTTVSFHVELSHTLSSVEDKDILKFNKVITNKGGHYNASSGFFRAPRRGSYMVWANIYMPVANSFINIIAHKEDTIIAHKEDTIIAHGHAETSHSILSGIASILAVTYLYPDQRIWFSKDSGSSVLYGTDSDGTSSYGAVLLRSV